jgi:hypothetical protein
MNELVETWLGAQTIDIESEKYENVAWAVDQLFDMAHDDPELMLQTVAKILAADASPKVLGALGAGVVEEALVNHGESVIGSFGLLAKSNPDFKKCLQYTYIDSEDVSPNVYQKFVAIKSDQ